MHEIPACWCHSIPSPSRFLDTRVMLPRVLSERCPVPGGCYDTAEARRYVVFVFNYLVHRTWAQKVGIFGPENSKGCVQRSEQRTEIGSPSVSVTSPVLFGGCGCEEESIYLNSMQRGSSMCYHFGSALNIQQCRNVLHFPTMDSGHCTWRIMWMLGVWLS